MFSVLLWGICAGKKILFGSLIPPLLLEGGAMPFENVILLFKIEEFQNRNSIKPSVEPLEAQDCATVWLACPQASPAWHHFLEKKRLGGFSNCTQSFIHFLEYLFLALPYPGEDLR